jgi:Tol biopolymer transport system component
VINTDGRYVAFPSDGSNLVAGDTNGVRDIFVHDRQTGVTVAVSVGVGGVQGDDLSRNPAISDDGRYVAFSSPATNLDPRIRMGCPIPSSMIVIPMETESLMKPVERPPSG